MEQNIVQYKDLNIKIKEEYTTITFNNQEIQVYKYIPIRDKFDLINSVLDKSLVDGIYDPLRLEVYTELYTVMLYTNLVFSMEDREDEFILYDNLVTSGLSNQILDEIPANELNFIQGFIDETVRERGNYNSSMAGVIRKAIDDLPKNAEAAAKIVEEFNPEKYNNVLQFAQAANGNRNIKTNQDIVNDISPIMMSAT